MYLSYGDATERHIDFTCNLDFSDFLISELLPSVEDLAGPHLETFLCGLSLSGLAAAYTVLSKPGRFSGALCQSPSAWWRDEWLAENCGSMGESRLWISVGTEEVQENVAHGPSDLFQKVSQIESCRRLADALRNGGSRVAFNVFEGGHDPACWATELPSGLRWLLSQA
ncbi:putative esterase [Fimbriimonas ginsengisoli Gsoil 348]|uniref:Putative esterase n=1 Tax=Fimbriimonas ginsengisoli Gsoil 348 TaxID=661478 RepID=A0A068NTT1_FIMGI|nr:putative esterase [Fimbriimonas ginsengisoli Gsoil 348]